MVEKGEGFTLTSLTITINGQFRDQSSMSRLGYFNNVF